MHSEHVTFPVSSNPILQILDSWLRRINFLEQLLKWAQLNQSVITLGIREHNTYYESIVWTIWTALGYAAMCKLSDLLYSSLKEVQYNILHMYCMYFRSRIPVVINLRL